MDNLVTYYLKANQLCTTYYRMFWLYFFNVGELKIFKGGQMYNGIWRYFAFNIFTNFIWSIDCFRGWVFNLQNKLDISAEKIHVTKMTDQGDKTFILEGNNNQDVSLRCVSDALHNVVPDDTMLNCIFLTFDLVNDDGEKKCLKEYVIKYKDTDEKHPHTLKNIFTFNDIEHTDNSKITLKIAKNRKISNHELLLKDVSDKHINYFINL